MYLNGASDFSKTLGENFNVKIFPCCIPLYRSCLKVLAAFLSPEVLVVFTKKRVRISHAIELLPVLPPFLCKSTEKSSELKYQWRIKVQTSVIHSFACYLRSGDYIRRVVDKTKCEYKVVVSE